jgi:hypothetical protein
MTMIFKKNIISIEIMPNGRLKCSIELNYQIDFEISQIWSKSLKIIRPFQKQF